MVQRSNWTERTITLPPRQLFTFTPGGPVLPNFVLVTNHGIDPVYVGRSSALSTSRFDLKIPAKALKRLVRPQGMASVYLYADSDDPTVITLATDVVGFDSLMITETMDTQTVLDTALVIQTIEGPLPPGDNTIGRVRVTQVDSTVDVNVLTMPEGCCDGGGGGGLAKVYMEIYNEQPLIAGGTLTTDWIDTSQISIIHVYGKSNKNALNRKVVVTADFSNDGTAISGTYLISDGEYNGWLDILGDMFARDNYIRFSLENIDSEEAQISLTVFGASNMGPNIGDIYVQPGPD